MTIGIAEATGKIKTSLPIHDKSLEFKDASLLVIIFHNRGKRPDSYSFDFQR